MKNQKNKKSPVSTICSALGTVLLVIIIIGCIPLTVPRAMGYELYTVITGSMEPNIPVGSLVFVKDVDPIEVQEKDVIAFYGGKDSNAIITHRVVENRTFMGEFITKGDANSDNDMNPVSYNELIGRVELSVPYAGSAAQFLTSMQGKITAASLIGLAIILNILASVLDRKR